MDAIIILFLGVGLLVASIRESSPWFQVVLWGVALVTAVTFFWRA